MCVLYDCFRGVSLLVVVFEVEPVMGTSLYTEKAVGIYGRCLDVVMVSEKEAVQCRVAPILGEIEVRRCDATDD